MREQFEQEVFDLVTQDSDIQALYDAADEDEVPFELNFAQKDQQYPYMVYSLDYATQDPWPIVQGTLIIDIWGCGGENLQPTRVAQRLQEILDRKFPVTNPSTGEFAAARLWLDDESAIPTGEQEIHHIAQLYGFRVYRVKAAQAVLDRPC